MGKRQELLASLKALSDRYPQRRSFTASEINKSLGYRNPNELLNRLVLSGRIVKHPKSALLDRIHWSLPSTATQNTKKRKDNMKKYVEIESVKPVRRKLSNLERTLVALYQMDVAAGAATRPKERFHTKRIASASGLPNASANLANLVKKGWVIRDKRSHSVIWWGLTLEGWTVAKALDENRTQPPIVQEEVDSSPSKQPDARRGHRQDGTALWTHLNQETVQEVNHTTTTVASITDWHLNELRNGAIDTMWFHAAAWRKLINGNYGDLSQEIGFHKQMLESGPESDLIFHAESVRLLLELSKT